MDVKPGYKQTEVGVIPEDWKIKPLGEMFSFSGGLSASRANLGYDGYCYLHYGDIHTSSNFFVDVETQHGDLPKLDIELSKVSTKSLLSDGDVVFVDASEDDEGASKHQVIRNAKNTPFISGLHTIVAKSRTNDLIDRYKEHCFQTQSVKKQFLFYSVGTKVTGISKTNIAKILLPVPPQLEQKAIAEALSDADAYITSLNQLIAKKRLTKQGAMQELLTGRRRLPGFSGEWEKITIGDLGNVQRGVSYNPSHDLYQFDTLSSVRLLRSNNIQEATLVFANMQYVDISRVSANQILKNNDVVICMANGSKELVGKAARFLNDDGFVYTFGSFMGCFRPNIKTINPEFAFYLFLTEEYRSHISILLAGSSINNLTPASVEALVAFVPSKAQEQDAIANVLGEMDTELKALETELNKARQVKQGMMQELLTGRIRLL